MTFEVYSTLDVNEAWLILVSYTQGVTLETHKRFKVYFNGRRKQDLNHTDALKQARTLTVNKLPKVEFTLEGGP